MSAVFKFEDHLSGIRYWAAFWPAPRVPRFEVFRYVGKDLTNGLFMFQSVKDKRVTVTRNFYQLTTSLTFRPFLYNRDVIDAHLRSGGYIL